MLWKVQWLQVHIPPPEAPIGGNGDAPGPTYEACLARPGVVGAEIKTFTGFIQASLSKIQGLIKDFPIDFKDNKFMRNTDLSVKCPLQKC